MPRQQPRTSIYLETPIHRARCENGANEAASPTAISCQSIALVYIGRRVIQLCELFSAPTAQRFAQVKSSRGAFATGASVAMPGRFIAQFPVGDRSLLVGCRFRDRPLHCNGSRFRYLNDSLKQSLSFFPSSSNQYNYCVGNWRVWRSSCV